MSRNGLTMLRYSGLYKPKTPARIAFAEVLESHIEVIRSNRAGALKGADSAHLHDIRVAFRRMRRAISFFSSLSNVKHSAGLDKGLKQLCMELGRMRDLQARLELLDSVCIGPDVNLEVYRQKCCRDIADGMAGLRKTMSGAAWKSVLEISGDLARSCRRGSGAGKLIRDYASVRILKEFKKFEGADFRGVSRMSSESLHSLRKKFRNFRYHIEFCAPVLGERFADMEDLLRVISQMMGRIHDADVSLAFASKSSDVRWARIVIGAVQKERRKNLRELTELLKKARGCLKG